MQQLEFAGGVDLGKPFHYTHGSVESIREPVPKTVSSYHEIKYHDVPEFRRDTKFIQRILNKSLETTETPELDTTTTVDIIKAIKNITSRMSLGNATPSSTEAKYVPVEQGDTAGKQHQTQAAIAENNASVRTEYLLDSIKREFGVSHGLIANMSGQMSIDLGNVRDILSGIFNRKVGADDRFQKALLATQYKQEIALNELIFVSRSANSLAEEQRKRILHNTGLADQHKTTKEERTSIRDEQRMYDLKVALIQGNLESNLKHLNSIWTNKAKLGAERNWKKLKSKVFGDGDRSVYSHLKERTGNNWTNLKTDVSEKGVFGTIGSGLKSGVVSVGNGLSRVGSAVEDGVDKTINRSFMDNVKAAGKTIAGEDSVLRRHILPSVKSFVAGTVDGIDTAFGSKSPQEMEIENNKALHVTIPEHLSNIHKALLSLNSLGNGSVPVSESTLPQSKDSQPDITATVTPDAPTPAPAIDVPKPTIDDRLPIADVPKPAVQEVSASVIKQDTPETPAQHASAESTVNKIATLVKISDRLIALPEYRKLRKYTSRIPAKHKRVQPDQVYIGHRLTEQVALQAQMLEQLKKLDGGKSGLAGLLGMGGSLLSGAGSAAGSLTTLLPMVLRLAASPAGLTILGMLAVYLGKDAIADAVSDVYSTVSDKVGKVGNAISAGVTNGWNAIEDAGSKVFGKTPVHEEVAKLKAQQELTTGVTPANLIETDQQLETDRRTANRMNSAMLVTPGLGLVTYLKDKWLANNTSVYDTNDSPEEGVDNAYQDSPLVSTETVKTKGYTGQLRNAGGEAYFLPDEEYRGFIDGVATPLQRVAVVSRATRGNFIGMAYEYNLLTKKRLYVVDSVRTSSEQAYLYRTKPKGKAAPQGTSMHEFGLALDIDSLSGNLAECERLGLMRKYGFWRPIATEPWHIEAIGINPYVAKIVARTMTPESLAPYVMGSRGSGGGGPGITSGYKTRSHEAYEAIIKGGNSVQTAKSITDAAPGSTGAEEKSTVLEPGSSNVGSGVPSSIPVGGTALPSGAGMPPPPPGPYGGMGATSSAGTGSSGPVSDSPISKLTKTEKHGSMASFNDRARFVMRKLMELGWSRAAALGMAANIDQESDFRPDAELVDDTGSTAGIVQWRGARQRKFKELYGKDLKGSSLEEQVKYLDWELRNKGGDKPTYEAGLLLQQATSPEQATEIFLKKVERPGNIDREIPKRMKNLAEMTKLLGSDTGTSPTTALAGTTPSQPTTPPVAGSKPSGYYSYGPNTPAEMLPSKDTASVSRPSMQPVSTPTVAPPPVTDSGFMKTSLSAPLTQARTDTGTLNRTDIKTVFDQSLLVQKDMLTELRKIYGAVSGKGASPQPPPTVTPPTQTKAKLNGNVYERDTVGVSI